MTETKFDAYARSYEDMHAASIAASGESTDYFAQYKLDCLMRIGAEGPVLDYGCGIGNLTEKLVGWASEVHGYDPSRESLAVAKKRAPSAILFEDADALPREHYRTAVLAGVLHHVPPRDRVELLRSVREKLRPDGRLVVFEHNPLNPLTRKAVADCPFDDDAILLPPWEAKRLLAKTGYANVRLDYIVFFPKVLAFLRPLEPKLRRLLLGAQTMLVAERGPLSSDSRA